MDNIDELKRRLAQLERENAGLKGIRQLPKPQDIATVVASFKGNPILKFDGPFRPFSLGLKKCYIILQKLDDMKFFVENNKHRLNSPVADEDSE